MTYIKALITLAVAVVAVLVTGLGTGDKSLSDLSTQEWLVAAVAVLGSPALVWFASNGPAAPAIKAVIAFLSAGLGSLVVANSDSHITQAEWLIAFSAAVVATGLVYQATDPSLPPDGGARA